MFGLSFGELMLIGVVGLVALAPERLPALMHRLGRFLGGGGRGGGPGGAGGWPQGQAALRRVWGRWRAP